MKLVIAWILILGGVVIGATTLFYGFNKVKNSDNNFNALLFLRKCCKNTSINEFTGYELVFLGILSILGAGLIYLIIF